MNVRLRGLALCAVLCWAMGVQAREPSASGNFPSPSMVRMPRAVAFVAEHPSPAAPGIVYLHGICGRAENGCGHFASGAGAWLLCPRAPNACAGGGESWGDARQAAEIVRGAESDLAASTRATGRPHGRILVGFSQGGYVARAIYGERPNTFRGMMVLGADVRFGRAELERAGVRRVALGAGRFDATWAPLRRASAALAAEGFPVRFVDLGEVGHTYVAAPTSASAIPDALSWLAEAEAGG